MRVLTLCVLLVLISGTGALAEMLEQSVNTVPLFDIRLRQESLDGVYHFTPETDRNWIRMRTRAGLEIQTGNHSLSLRLNNEHRHFLTPDDVDLDWDEVILDRAQWTWKPKAETTLTVGRQDIIWDGGFLMLEGHPLDGSRSNYHNAIRLQHRFIWGDMDLALIHNPKRDPIVLIDDEDRAICDADETAIALRLRPESLALAFIWKNEDDPDGLMAPLQTCTFSGRYDTVTKRNSMIASEIALQYQDGGEGLNGAGVNGWTFACDHSISHSLSSETTGRLGFFLYAGQDDVGMPAFRTPWGKWPKWSELYIYSLLGEGAPGGRAHVAAWENIAAPHLTLRRPLGDRIGARFSTYVLLAPKPYWARRGTLTEAELRFDIRPGLTGHLLWERLAPGSFHNGDNGLPPLEDTVHFIRWQLSYAFK